ncbi:MAG TPA: tetratricopeptide repeat protein [Rhizomicrobium sp.]|jgi:tetratricopeptide (TPR) repeat protein|nr:tetratricopeptide repeat protein [Rhizomicrobium sp.]
MADTPHGPFFRRHVPPDPDGLRAEIARQRVALAEAKDEAARLDALGRLGFALFMIGEEAEAAPLLDEALVLARQRGDAKTEIEVLLGLATARQYLGERARAERLFREALALCGETGIREQEHFLLHHLGRCYVEMGRIDEAKVAFEQALAIRQGLDNKRFANFTQAALDDVAAMPSGGL